MTRLAADGEIASLVDRLLLEQGRLDPLELLMAAEMLAYEHYEAWRMGKAPDLQGLLVVAPEDAADLLHRAGTYALAQRLSEMPLEHSAWGGKDLTLCVGTHAGFVRGCAKVYEPPVDRLQLDLFQDSRGLLLEEEIRRTLAERHTDAARQALGRLMQHDPRRRHLHGFLRLIEVVDETGSAPPKARLGELQAIEPLARELLGYRARDFLAHLWAGLAESLAGVPFSPHASELHSSFAWARAGRWEAAGKSVEQVPGWGEHPSLLQTHAEACYRSREWSEARRDWMRLCWDFPTEAEDALGSVRFPDRGLAAQWNQFRDADLKLETEDFPSWLLVTDPSAGAAVPPSAAPTDDREDAYRLLHRLVSGEDDVALRRELAEVHPDLLKLYLSRRA